MPEVETAGLSGGASACVQASIIGKRGKMEQTMNAEQKADRHIFPDLRRHVMPAFLPPSRQVPVRDPLTGGIILATVFNSYAQEIVAKLETEGFLDAVHILTPERSLSTYQPDELPSWHLVQDGDRAFLFPLLVTAR
jgi:hypothetical protein